MTKLYSTWLCLFVCESFIKIYFREVGGRSCKYLSYQRIQKSSYLLVWHPCSLGIFQNQCISAELWVLFNFTAFTIVYCSLWESNVVPRLLSIYEKSNLRTRLTCLLSFQAQHEENFSIYFYLFLTTNIIFMLLNLDSNFTEWCRITSLNIYGNVTRITTKLSMQREYITINTSPFLSLRY